MKRPNILFLMSDEHRADVTGYEGNSIIRTPNLDRLAGTGVVFRNAYTPSPICIPGRQAIMAGQLPRTCKSEVYGQDLAPGYMTFARLFSQYAYTTTACGKLHHTGTDQLQGWTTRVGGDVSIGSSYIQDKQQDEFNAFANFKKSVKWSDAKEVKRAGIGKGPGYVKDQYTLQGALDFIESYFCDPYHDRPQPEKPLMLKVSLIQPHYPYLANEREFTYYLNRVQPYLDQKVSDHPFLSSRQVVPGIDASVREIRRATAAYYGMIEQIDQRYGVVLDALENVGQDLDDWIIIYTSDHGEMLGQHGIWEKQKFYEASARVPLIIRWPKGFDGGRVVNENVNLCDLFATLCDLAGIPTPSGLDSRSLVPLINDDAGGWNNETVSQFGKRNLMIKRDNLKYQYYGEDMPEVLFDLSKDSDENINFIDCQEYEEVLKQFRQRRGELGFGPNADPCYVNAGY